MDTKVGCISCDKSSGKRNSILTQDQSVEEKECGCQEYAHDWGHGQAGLVFWEMVMCAMEYILQALLLWRGGFHVESIAMDQVFHEGKGEEAGHKKQDTGPWAKDTVIDRVA